MTGGGPLLPRALSASRELASSDAFLTPSAYNFSTCSPPTDTTPTNCSPTPAPRARTTGPLISTAASAAFVLVGFALSSAGLGDVSIDSPAFLDSALMSLLAQLFLGDSLTQPEVAVSSLLVAGWAGLIFNALNCLPAGELDGGRVASSLWGRKAAEQLSTLTFILLGLGATTSALAFYWVGLTLFLQRGPLLPCAEELSEPRSELNRAAGLALLALPLLVLLPAPVDLMAALEQLTDPVPF